MTSNKLSILTPKVRALSEFPDMNTDDVVDWALDMLKLGCENENVLILAGMSKPTSYFELGKYLETALEELKIPSLKGKEAIGSLGYYYVNKLIESSETKTTLKNLCDLCIATDYEESLFDFYRLYWACDDFDYGLNHQAHWSNATKSTIKSIVIEKAENWLAARTNHSV